MQGSGGDLVEGEAEQRGSAGGEPAKARFSGADEVGDRGVGGDQLVDAGGEVAVTEGGQGVE
ncbi:hypothetical protein [Gordonia aquimaris]|uniref:Uncharacterized protein n=1 Tax=Gordonia aquimaris TaxID=2984863 RepID=A0A9X3I6H3_9ACTN|nr:hypothetical protein [Gordonia aquimaris]MCX2966296.1 hypothetical protein [Gordonia aquimaris]